MGAQPRLAVFVDVDEHTTESDSAHVLEDCGGPVRSHQLRFLPAADDPRTPKPRSEPAGRRDHEAWLAEARSWTVPEAFERGKRLDLEAEHAAKSTLQGYATHLRRWDEFWSTQTTGAGSPDKYRSDGPILPDVRRRDLEDWRSWLLSELRGQNVAHNANKHVRSIEAILNWAERREVIVRAPSLEALSATVTAPKLYFTHDQIDRLYRHAGQLAWPVKSQRGSPLPFSPARYWRAAIVLFFHYGFRTQELLRWESDHDTLCWRNIHFDRETPAEDGHATNEHGWLWYVPQKQRGSKPVPVVLPLTATTAAHLQSIEPPGGADPERPVFDWPFSNDSLYGSWDLLCELADVRPKRRLGAADDEQPKFHLLHWRKTCTTWANHHRAGLGPLITGHADRELTRHARATATLGELASAGTLSAVNAKHYDHSGELAVVEGLNSLPVPASFRSIFDAPLSRQRSLF